MISFLHLKDAILTFNKVPLFTDGYSPVSPLPVSKILSIELEIAHNEVHYF